MSYSPASSQTRQVRTTATDSPSRRTLTGNETLLVRKILACATRLTGRFGKHTLAATLRGSAAKNLTRAHLNELSTYGLLKEMRQDDILLYTDALIAAGYLALTSGEYPTVHITKSGERVMRDQQRAELPLPELSADSYVSAPSAGAEQNALSPAARQADALYRQGLSVEQIASRRNCLAATIEAYLAECLQAGFPIAVSQFVSPGDRALIETAIATQSTKKLKPIYDALPDGITYNMIRFVVAELTCPQKATE